MDNNSEIIVMLKRFVERNFIWVLFSITYMLFALTTPKFFALDNAFNILNQNAYLLIAALGISFIMMSGEMDFSIGYQMSIISVLCAICLVSYHTPTWAVILLGIGLGVLFSLLNTILSRVLGIPRIFVSLGVMTVCQGLAFIVSGAKSIAGLPADFKSLGQATVFGVNLQFPVILAFILFVIVSLVIEQTYFGRHVIALGGNKNAARLAGINVKRTEIYIGVIAGALCGLAALVLTARMGSTLATVAVGTEFSVITGALLGGVSIRGGEGKVRNVMGGILIVSLLGNGMQLAGINSYYQFMVKGVIMLATIGFDTYQYRMRSVKSERRA